MLVFHLNVHDNLIALASILMFVLWCGSFNGCVLERAERRSRPDALRSASARQAR